MKLTNLQMDWTDTGATVSYTTDTAMILNCPRCGGAVNPNTVHRCGDHVKPKSKRKPVKS